ncbi:MAG: hypothetical protein NZM31_06845, partial [Gemmatales bacterium]|nr:hypothetical protein [Gemmatales bacterium]MDW8386718.1 hypothetical protein [Gemmatales bacterium]
GDGLAVVPTAREGHSPPIVWPWGFRKSAWRGRRVAKALNVGNRQQEPFAHQVDCRAWLSIGMK